MPGQNRHLWAHGFEHSSQDVLALQDELASAIAHEIDVCLTPGELSRLARATSVNTVAYGACLKGRNFRARFRRNRTVAVAQKISAKSSGRRKVAGYKDAHKSAERPALVTPWMREIHSSTTVA
jgi:hypothetical protein